MDNIPGFPFLRKAPQWESSRTEITCQNCATLVVVEDSLWVNAYTNEQYIFCKNCVTLVGMWYPLRVSGSSFSLPDST